MWATPSSGSQTDTVALMVVIERGEPALSLKLTAIVSPPRGSERLDTGAGLAPFDAAVARCERVLRR